MKSQKKTRAKSSPKKTREFTTKPMTYEQAVQAMYEDSNRTLLPKFRR